MVVLRTIYFPNFRLKKKWYRTGNERAPARCRTTHRFIDRAPHKLWLQPVGARAVRCGAPTISLFQFIANIAGPCQVCYYNHRTNQNQNPPVHYLKSMASQGVRKSQGPIGFVKSSSVMLFSMLGTCHFNIYLTAADFKHEAGYLYSSYLFISLFIKDQA